jgi:DNA polymerase-1
VTDEKKPTLLLIDGHSLAFRAFYALPVDSFKTDDGQHTNAIHGFISMLLNLLAKEKPTHLAVAFDISRYSFRTREYPDYKGTRGETPVEFIGQIPLLQDALHAMNIVTIMKEDFEADDILATLAHQGERDGYHVLVVSGDRDTIQLVNENVTLLYPSTQGVSALTRYDPEKVRERYGINPEQYPEIAALVGETSDNLPGIPKVGEKTAVKWITQFGSLDAILEHADDITGKVGESLREHKENAIRNRRLNRLVTDVELPVTPADLSRVDFNVDAVRDVFTRLQFRTLQERVLKLSGGDSDADVPGARSTKSNAATTATVTSSPTEILAAVASCPAPQTLLDEELAGWIHRAGETSPQGIAIHVEMAGSAIFSVGLASHDACVNVPWNPGADMEPLRDLLAGPVPVVFYAAKPQVKALAQVKMPVVNISCDAEIADWLVRPDVSSRSLSGLVLATFGVTLAEGDANALINDGGLSAGEMAWWVGQLAHTLSQRLSATDLALLLDIEMPTLLSLAAMEVRGVSVNADKLATLSLELGERAASAQNRAFSEIGREVNLASPKQLQEVLFEQLNMPKTRQTKTGYTTDAAALTDLQISNPHPFLDALLDFRDTTKLRQIVEVLAGSIASDGRIHTTYVQTGTSTGRLSSANPNLQNIPVRTADGRRIREAFQVGEGFECLLTADYSQIEMRVMAHFSQDEGLIEAFISGEDLHRFVGARVFSVAPQDVSPEMRTKVKAMSYGLAYGLSAFGLARQLKIPNSEAKTLMQDYFARFGGVRDYLRGVVEEAKANGYTETLFGRRRPFPDLQSPNRVLRDNAERAALNAPMQGTAADIMKIAMNGIESDLTALDLSSRLLMQVHDELIVEVSHGEWDTVERIVRERMSNAAQLRVPLEVQVGRGSEWNEAAH